MEVYIVNPITKEPAKKYFTRYKWEPTTRKSSSWLGTTQMNAEMTILDSFDNEVHKETYIKESNGTIVFTYKVPKDTKGGEYRIRVKSSDFPTTFRKFRIN